MFLGHYALGFAGKRIVPAVSLGTLFLACQLADLLWPTFVLAGIERVEVAPGDTAFTPLSFVHYPYSHSLLALTGWGLLLGVLYIAVRRSGVRAGLVLGLLVVSHWVLDFVAHRPDLPLVPGGSGRYGLGMWNSVPGTMAVELLLFLLGVGLYARATAPRDRAGSYGLWALVGFLLLIFLANAFGSPPPGPAAVAWVTEAMWLLVLWGWWVDRHRQPRSHHSSETTEPSAVRG